MRETHLRTTRVYNSAPTWEIRKGPPEWYSGYQRDRPCVCVTVGCLVVGAGVDPVVGVWKGGGGLMWRGHYTVYWLVSIAPHVK